MLFGKKKDKPTKEERILQTKVQLEQLKDKYEHFLEMQRRILNKRPTPHEKEMAEAKIRSGICAYTICAQASRDLDDITSDMELNQSLKELNRALKQVNKFGKTSVGPFTKHSLNKGVEKLKKREDSIKPGEVFTDDTQANVDDWLGSKWDNVAGKFIRGTSLRDCLDETRVLMETDPLPFMSEDIFGSDGSGGLENASEDLQDLLNSDIF